jgi:hypothetical protein
LQHDILFLLVGSYLDEDKKLFVWVTDIHLFMSSLLTVFIVNTAYTQAEQNYQAMLFKWINWQTHPNNAVCPMITWLRDIYQTSSQSSNTDIDFSWKSSCVAFIEAQLQQLGVNPADLKPTAADFVPEHMQSAAIPLSHSTVTPLLIELKQASLFSVRNITDSDASQLFELFNQQLQKFIMLDEQNEFEKIAPYIEFMYQLLILMRSLYKMFRYQLLIGAEDAEFYDDQNALIRWLTPLLEHDLVNINEKTKQIFIYEVEHYNKKKDECLSRTAKIIEDFFAVISAEERNEKNTFESALGKINSLEEESPGSVTLTDAQLSHWGEQAHLSLSADSHEIEITPYEINRMLLHALLVNPNEWSALYCQYLLLVVSWLTNVQNETDGLTQVFKRNYSSHFLAGLIGLAVMKSNPDTAGIDCTRYKGDLQRTIYERAFISLEISRFFTSMNEEQRRSYLVSLQHYLSSVITSPYTLLALLEQPLTVSSSEMRDTIWESMKKIPENIAWWIGDIQSLLLLHNIKLTTPQRKLMFELIPLQGWGRILTRDLLAYPNLQPLHILLRYPSDILTEAQRTNILGALSEAAWESLIPDQYRLRGLFDDCPLIQLTKNHRMIILTALNPRLSQIFKNIAELVNFIAPPIDIFSSKPFSELYNAQRLSPDQCDYIWERVLPQFFNNLLSFWDLTATLSLPIDALSVARRQQMFNALDATILKRLYFSDRNNGKLLVSLFKYTIEQVTIAQRSELLEKMGVTSLQEETVQALLALPIELCTAEHRTLLIDGRQIITGTQAPSPTISESVDMNRPEEQTAPELLPQLEEQPIGSASISSSNQALTVSPTPPGSFFSPPTPVQIPTRNHVDTTAYLQCCRLL